MGMKTIDQVRRETARQENEDAKRIQFEIEDVREVLTLPAGRRLLWRILGDTGLMDHVNPEYEDLLIFTGRREVGLDILSLIVEADENAYPRMIMENIPEKIHKSKEENDV